MTHFLRDFKKRGFSLIEVIVATVIISVLAAGVFAATSFAQRAQFKAHDRFVALSILERKLNELQLMDISDVVSGVETTTVAEDGLIGNLRITATDPPGADAGRAKDILLDLAWTDNAGNERTESLASYLYEE